MLSSDRFSPRQKKGAQKKLIGECSVCGRIPTKISTKDIGGASLIERYCETCFDKSVK